MDLREGASGQRDSGEERRRTVGRRLTDRQSALLGFVADGLENKEIAQRLGIGEQTVKDQISNLLHRLAVRNRAALAEIATELRIFGTTLEASWLRHLFTDAPLGIALMRGPEHRFELANEYARRYLGNRELDGKTVREAFPEIEPSSFGPCDRAYSTGQPVAAHEYELRWDRLGQGPEQGFLDFVVQPLRDVAGDVNGLLVMGMDATDLVRARRRWGLTDPSP